MFLFMALGGIMGAIIPSVWLSIYYFYVDGRIILFGLPTWVETLFIILCPSSLLFFYDPSDSSVILPIIVIVINAFFYSIIGLLLWIGLYKSQVVLIALVIIFLPYLYKIITL